MGETLKERLDRLSEDASQGEWEVYPTEECVSEGTGDSPPVYELDGCAQLLSPSSRHDIVMADDHGQAYLSIDDAVFIAALVSAYRSGDLIPRDEITRQMAAEVLLSNPEALAEAMAETMNGGMWSSPSHYNRDQRDVWIGYATRALTAIKEADND